MKNILIGILTTLSLFIISRIIFYFIIVSVEKIYIRYFKKPNYKIIIINILEHLSNNQQFISDVSSMINIDNNKDEKIYLNLISLEVVQELIQSEIETSEIKLNKSEIEHQLKLVLIKSFGCIDD